MFQISVITYKTNLYSNIQGQKGHSVVVFYETRYTILDNYFKIVFQISIMLILFLYTSFIINVPLIFIKTFCLSHRCFNSLMLPVGISVAERDMLHNSAVTVVSGALIGVLSGVASTVIDGVLSGEV